MFLLSERVFEIVEISLFSAKSLIALFVIKLKKMENFLTPKR